MSGVGNKAGNKVEGVGAKKTAGVVLRGRVELPCRTLFSAPP